MITIQFVYFFLHTDIKQTTIIYGSQTKSVDKKFQLNSKSVDKTFQLNLKSVDKKFQLNSKSVDKKFQLNLKCGQNVPTKFKKCGQKVPTEFEKCGQKVPTEFKKCGQKVRCTRSQYLESEREVRELFAVQFKLLPNIRIRARILRHRPTHLTTANNTQGQPVLDYVKQFDLIYLFFMLSFFSALCHFKVNTKMI